MEPALITDTLTYLTFTLDGEDFAVEVANVREVLDYTSVTRVPRTPDFMRGVINLRGSVVPVVDMRLKFGMPRGKDTVDTCIVVMEVDLDGEATVIGALADSVQEVFDMDPGLIEPPPRIGTVLNTEFIRGMGKHDENFIIILNIDRVFSSEELLMFMETGEPSPSTVQNVPLESASEKASGKVPSDAAGTPDPETAAPPVAEMTGGVEIEDKEPEEPKAGPEKAGRTGAKTGSRKTKGPGNKKG